MPKLKGKAKEEFLRRMARGRAKAKPARTKRTNPKPARAKHANPKPARKRTNPKPTAAKRTNPKPTGRKRANLKRRNATRKNAIAPRKRNRRRNPDTLTEAAKQFESFHGKPAGKVVDYATDIQYRENFAELGELRELRFELDSANKHFPLTKFKGTQAVCTADGSTIYFLGGDQSISLRDLGIESDKDMVELGPCNYISYHTVKGFHDFEPITYFHHFGEEDGILPVLAYDRLNKTLFLLGGNYRVKPAGICN